MDHRNRAKLLDVRETRRVAQPFEFREDAASGQFILDGYAATWDAYDCYGGPDRGGWVEQLTRSSMNYTLNEKPDVMLLINHEGLPLARTKSGTLSLFADDHGLRMRALLDPSDPDVQRIEPKMRRGDLDEMSFSFRVKDQVWDNDYSHRTITELSLQKGDVSVVNYGMNSKTRAVLSSDAVGALAKLSNNELVELRSLERSELAAAMETLQRAWRASPNHDLNNGICVDCRSKGANPADPGYQADGKERYFCDTELHIRNAWTRINQVEVAAQYSSDDLAKVRGRIKLAMKQLGFDIRGDFGGKKAPPFKAGGDKDDDDADDRATSTLPGGKLGGDDDKDDDDDERSAFGGKTWVNFDGSHLLHDGICVTCANERDDKKPYGNVPYADPGYLDSSGKQAKGGNGVPRYPIDASHVQAAWSYINMPKNQKGYTAEQLSSIKGRIKSAMKKAGHDVSDDDKKARDTIDIIHADALSPDDVRALESQNGGISHIESARKFGGGTTLVAVMNDGTRTPLPSFRQSGQFYSSPAPAVTRASSDDCTCPDDNCPVHGDASRARTTDNAVGSGGGQPLMHYTYDPPDDLVSQSPQDSVTYAKVDAGHSDPGEVTGFAAPGPSTDQGSGYRGFEPTGGLDVDGDAHDGESEPDDDEISLSVVDRLRELRREEELPYMPTVDEAMSYLASLR